ncbi:MAG: pyridoxamine 5'-phosphate oxidase family protein [Gemmatimonadota bacterium]
MSPRSSGGTPDPAGPRRTRLKRLRERGSHDRDTIDAILAEGLVCHVGIAVEGQPFVIPMGYAPWDDGLVLHGSVGSRLMRVLGSGTSACVTVTLVDGIVVARSLFHSSMNYRSVIAFGTARLIEEPAEKARALEALGEHLIPGRTADARGASDAESLATAVLHFSIEEASAKVRSGPPIDDEEDLELPIWAGVIPLAVTPGVPVPAPDLVEDIEPPEYVKRYRSRKEKREARPG